MNNQIITQFSYVNHQINEPLNDENIISELNPSIQDVRSTPQFFVDTSNVNPYQSGTYTATLWCQVGDQKVDKTFKINVKDFNRLDGNQVVNNQNNNMPQQAPRRRTSTAKKIWIGILVFVLIVLGLTSCSIYNQAKANQANDTAQNQQLKTQLAEVKAAQKTYQEDHNKQELDNTLNNIKNDIDSNNASNNSAINGLENQISNIKNNPDSDVENKLDGIENQIEQQGGLLQEIQNTLSSIASKIGL
ncbi:hypothetical protein ACQW5G_03830 [Fructilactobacillus sp. Tb1]|uniref:hypothetical protein n=1 Tax=Fructilactobacillus sp. Tb1 TaxID=3422304 RepID=UPI003D267E3F